ncbi:MAG: TetR/AcrR family transcriptional regulator [Firmicutes bacterium]|nr:TetR/AcrR family transcriptional regulator [Bacillota bacterium]
MAITKKGIEKKEYIVEKAAAVFVQKGFTAVTMEDIVEACGISRGGLYAYYSSTKEIFEDIVFREKNVDYSFFTEGMENEKNSIQILTGFFEQQKNELLRLDTTIRRAVYEFFLFHKEAALEDAVKQNYRETVSIISRTLAYGIARNEIYKITFEDTEKVANHMIILLEGLSILALSKQISRDLIDEQLEIMIKNLI